LVVEELTTNRPSVEDMSELLVTSVPFSYKNHWEGGMSKVNRPCTKLLSTVTLWVAQASRVRSPLPKVTGVEDKAASIAALNVLNRLVRLE